MGKKADIIAKGVSSLIIYLLSIKISSIFPTDIVKLIPGNSDTIISLFILGFNIIFNLIWYSIDMNKAVIEVQFKKRKNGLISKTVSFNPQGTARFYVYFTLRCNKNINKFLEGRNITIDFPSSLDAQCTLHTGTIINSESNHQLQIPLNETNGVEGVYALEIMCSKANANSAEESHLKAKLSKAKKMSYINDLFLISFISGVLDIQDET